MANLRDFGEYKRLQEGFRTSARNMWLAGLGVVSTVEEQGGTLFEELVERGKKMEAQGRKRWSKARRDLGSTTEELTDKLDERVSGVLQRMGVPSRSQVEHLTQRVDKLVGQVERLSGTAKRTRARSKAKKTPARRKTKAA